MTSLVYPRCWNRPGSSYQDDRAWLQQHIELRPWIFRLPLSYQSGWQLATTAWPVTRQILNPLRWQLSEKLE